MPATEENTAFLAIKGPGCLILQDLEGDFTYIRSGEFVLDDIIYDLDSQPLLGFVANPDEEITTSEPTPIPVTKIFPPKATNSLVLDVSLNFNDPIPSKDFSKGFTPNNQPSPNSFNTRHDSYIFDEVGKKHCFSIYFVKHNLRNIWKMHFALNDHDIAPYHDQRHIAIFDLKPEQYSADLLEMGDFSINGISITGRPRDNTNTALVELINRHNIPGITAIAYDNDIRLFSLNEQNIKLKSNGFSMSLLNFNNFDLHRSEENYLTIEPCNSLLFAPEINDTLNYKITPNTTVKIHCSYNDKESKHSTIINDGHPTGYLNNFHINTKGFVILKFNNGKSKVIGQLAMADENNILKLQSNPDEFGTPGKNSAFGTIIQGMPKEDESPKHLIDFLFGFSNMQKPPQQQSMQESKLAKKSVFSPWPWI